MIGCSEFTGYYDWTFEWLRRERGEELVRQYWEQAISMDSQRHCRAHVIPGGFQGMVEYWTPTLEEESAGSDIYSSKDVFRIDMYACPSLGYNQQQGFAYYHDYCDHCMAWILPVFEEAGVVCHHEHNHRGQCYLEVRRKGDDPGPSKPGELVGNKDIRLRKDWISERIDGWVANQRQRARVCTSPPPPEPCSFDFVDRMGAPDFYFAVNATFRFVGAQFGEGGLRKYWREMGAQHYRFVTARIRDKGLAALRRHWEYLFAHEPGAQVALALEGGVLTLEVARCPAIAHLQAHDREIMPVYCEHCLHVSEAMCEPVGVSVTVEGGMGECRQRFSNR